MIFLSLSILSSSLIFLFFKGLKKYDCDTFPAIVINYAVAAIFGFFLNRGIPEFDTIVFSSWFPFAAALGLCFIFIFYLMAITTQKMGSSIAAVANKMSVVFPIIFAIILYGDQMPILKIIGILIAFIGLYFATYKPKTDINSKYWQLPLLLFILSGLLDTFVKYTQYHYLGAKAAEISLFTPVLFFFAAFYGTLYLLINFRKVKALNRRTIIAGILLGIINYWSIIFIIKALAQGDIESSVIFPINNMGVVVFTTLGSFLLFGEMPNRKNKIGILICLLAISLIAYTTG